MFVKSRINERSYCYYFFIIISNYKLKNNILFLIGFIFLSITAYFFSFNLQEYIDASVKSINILSDEHLSLRGQTSFRLLGAFNRLATDSIYTTFFGFGVLGGRELLDCQPLCLELHITNLVIFFK